MNLMLFVLRGVLRPGRIGTVIAVVTGLPFTHLLIFSNAKHMVTQCIKEVKKKPPQRGGFSDDYIE